MKLGNKIITDENELKELFNRYFPSIYVFACKLVNDEDEAKDIAQESFVRLWERDLYFENEKALNAYLYVMTKNSCLTHIKRKNKFESIDNSDNKILSEKNILEEIVKEESYRLLGNAIENLGSQSQKIINLMLDGMPNLEIAQKLNISINTVKTLKLRAYRALRNTLGHQFMAILLTQFLDLS